MYSIIDIFISLLNSSRVYDNYLILMLSYVELTICRLMVRLKGKTGL